MFIKQNLKNRSKTNLTTKPIIVISKKIAPKSVERNRIKRIIKEALRELNYPKTPLVVIVKKNISVLKTSEVKKNLQNLIQIKNV